MSEALFATLWAAGLALFVFLFLRLERRVERLDARVDLLAGEVREGFAGLRRDLAEEFRAQRAEVSAQVSAIANAINAGRRP